MPEQYSDWWWEDLPQRAKEAANTLGYAKKSWDDSKDVAYDTNDFKDLTQKEKQAAMFLGMDPMDKLEEAWWEDLDEATKQAATVLGFDQDKWDDDWEIEDLPCEDWWWTEMTKEQRQAARYFGYDRSTWDEEDYDDDEGEYKSDDEEEFGGGSTTSAAAAAPPKKQTAGKDNKPSKPKPKPKPKFSSTLPHGGDGGAEFDHGKHPRIKSLTVRAGKVVDGIDVEYNDKTYSDGGKGGGAETLTLPKGEYINEVDVRANKLVQCLTFKTNKGRTLGPCGGTGALGIDKKGEEFVCKAPPKAQLCGIKGRAGKYLDAIAFTWGPIPEH